MIKPFIQHIAIIGFSTLLAAFSAGSIIVFTDPDSAGIISFIFLYISLFLTVLGCLILIGLTLRHLFFPGLYINHFSQATRQAVILSILITLSLILQANRLLYWWVESSLILLFLSIEVFLSLKI